MKNNRKNRKYLKRKLKKTFSTLISDPIELKHKVQQSYLSLRMLKLKSIESFTVKYLQSDI
jgi:hypothetical protein